MRVSILGSERHTSFTDGGRELFDCAAQGRIDAFFFSGVQIDQYANINLLGLGSPPQMKRRFMGSFGAPYLSSLIPKVILFRTDHNPKTMVESVDFVTAPGKDGRWLITNRCVMRREAGKLCLKSIHPGQTLKGLQAATGFEIDAAVTETPMPDAAVQKQIRSTILPDVAEIYPKFAELF